jgi:hypothetical protein
MLPPLTVLSPHDEEQMIVFEMETIAPPVCLFPLVPSMASVSLDAAPIILDTKVDMLGCGEDAMLGSNTAPDDPSIHLHAFKQHCSDTPILLNS